ncbi:hypothetical protein [Pseudomonas sp. C9-3]|uniref:hypothetical protein n=1 Tax=Pseudomonas sp. C9-3 TaxID=3078264 RepID=UPI0028E361DA|nr:hypothetical protein [Pseudomonas sp. C9-3]
MSDESSAVEPTGQEVEQAQQAELNSTEQATVQEAEQPGEQQDDQRQKTPQWVQKRLGQLTARNHATQAELDAARRENETYRRLLDAQQNGDQVQLPQQQQDTRDPQALAQQIVQQQAFDARCNDAYAQGKAEFSDFDERIQNLTLLGQLDPGFLDAVTSMEKPHVILHALAGDLDNAARILSLSPVAQGRELERLAQKAAAPKTTPVSSAPAPITPVGGSAKVETDPSKMSTKDWMAWREKNAKTRF